MSLWEMPEFDINMMRGVSVITQMLYVAVFCTRYVDLFWTSPLHSWWDFILKNFYIYISY